MKQSRIAEMRDCGISKFSVFTKKRMKLCSPMNYARFLEMVITIKPASKYQNPLPQPETAGFDDHILMNTIPMARLMGTDSRKVSFSMDRTDLAVEKQLSRKGWKE
jgi:hypothetical protein